MSQISCECIDTLIKLLLYLLYLLTAVPRCKVNKAAASRKFHVVKKVVIKLRSLHSIHSKWKMANKAKIESGANYITSNNHAKVRKGGRDQCRVSSDEKKFNKGVRTMSISQKVSLRI